MALAGGLPVCGPNCNGVVSVRARAPLWGDSVEPLAGRPGGADHPERQRRRQRARAAPRDRLPHRRLDRKPGGARGRATGSRRSPSSTGCARSRSSSRRTATAPALARALAAAPSARSASPSSRSVPRRPAPAPPAPTPARLPATSASSPPCSRRPAPRSPRDPGSCWSWPGAWRAPPRAAGRDGGLAVLTCSGGDSGIAADLAGREGLPLPELAPETRDGPGRAAPAGGDDRQSRSTTPRCCGTSPRSLERVAEAVGSDPGIDQLLLLFDEPEGLSADRQSRLGPVRRRPGRRRRAQRRRCPSSPRPSPTCCPSAAPSSSPSAASRRWPVWARRSAAPAPFAPPAPHPGACARSPRRRRAVG